MKNTTSPNLGYLYFKRYYDNINYKNLKNNFESKNNEILNYVFQSSESFEIEEDGRYKSFSLITSYPGLLVGSGLTHYIGYDDEFKLGFSFDYTSGLPIIPGSSIKGVLRSAFPEKGQKYYNEKNEYIKDILKDIGNISNVDVEALKNEIFEGLKNDGKNLPIKKRDIFFDAIIIDTENEGKKILGEDYITPHLEPLKNPIPIKFLKVLPRVKFKFRFLLNDGIITAEQKKELFKKILIDLGVGAKTNVGYGVLVPPSKSVVGSSNSQKKEKDKSTKKGNFNYSNSTIPIRNKDRSKSKKRRK
jgi:CRISPR-associated protein Cmr6